MLHNSTENKEINPFTIQWLSENFDLNPNDVKKSGFDTLNIMYQIYFDELNSAKKFYNRINEAGCYPQIFEFANLVQLNPYSKEELILATKDHKQKDSPSSFTTKIPNELNSVDAIKFKQLSIFNSPIEKHLLPAVKEDLKSILELTLEKIIPIPFNLNWLSEYLGLNKKHVNKSNFDFDFMRYSITFDTLENAKHFYQILNKSGASLQIWEHSNTIEIPYSNQFKILRSVEQSDTGLNPWNIDFFVQYFNLNREQVTCDKNGSYHYTIEFRNAHDAYNYYEQLLEKGIYPKNPRSDGKLVFTNMDEYILKAAAKYVKQSLIHLNHTQQPFRF